MILIDWKKAENARKIKIELYNGQEILASGNGLEIGEDIGEDDDMFFIRTKEGPDMIPVSSIKNIKIEEMN
ncbi:hypothetical protein HMPREF3200_00594 [Anaerococcus tetradius]|uniref:Uncharacterized protein n=1 Tax=Anaerococcus tetradius TaxID=33036 RepID=A0A133KG78_9FIRM|nr:hypothetical protein HMPREF3200_00594 [Anaerococcus tetradius]